MSSFGTVSLSNSRSRCRCSSTLRERLLPDHAGAGSPGDEIGHTKFDGFGIIVDPLDIFGLEKDIAPSHIPGRYHGQRRKGDTRG